MISGFIGCCFPSNKNSVVEIKDVKFPSSSCSNNKLNYTNVQDKQESILCKQAPQVQSEHDNSEDRSKKHKKVSNQFNNSEKKTLSSNYKKKIEEEHEIENISRISNNRKGESFKDDKMSKQDTNNKLLFSKDEETPIILNDSEFISNKGDKNSRFFTEQENVLYPNLKLNLILGDCFDEKLLKINASGLIGSLRKAHDGITIFGCKSIEQIDQIYDYELTIKLGLNSTLTRPSLIFMIYFKKELKRYFIRACKNSQEIDEELPSILVQITKPLVRPVNYIVL